MEPIGAMMGANCARLVAVSNVASVSSTRLRDRLVRFVDFLFTSIWAYFVGQNGFATFCRSVRQAV